MLSSNKFITVDNYELNFHSIPNILEEIPVISCIGTSRDGKSTLLKLLYGEHDLKEGQILWNENIILGPSYNLVVGYDFIKYVSQEFDLMPFISVEENVGKFFVLTDGTFISVAKKKATFDKKGVEVKIIETNYKCNFKGITDKGYTIFDNIEVISVTERDFDFLKDLENSIPEEK